ncbi:MAG: DNA polymerase III subunit alpha [Brevinematia bacterium]
MKEFSHLHLHTEYSLLDGAIKIPKLVSKIKEMGMNSVAITDHGNLFGSIEFYKTCKENEIKPIIGVEAYLVEDMHKKEKIQKSETELEKQYTHIVLLSKDLNGYKNLVKIVTKSYLEGFYYKPRIDKKLLEQHKEGLIVLSGCIAGEIPQLILIDKYKEAQRIAEWYISTFGRDNFYIEIQKHNLEEEKKVNPGLIKLAKEMGLKLVATGDAHYLSKEDANIHDVLLCIQTNSKIFEENRFKFSNDSFYVKSPQEMWKEFGNELPEALISTIEIAEKCNLEIPFGNKELMPRYYENINENIDADEKIKDMVFEGLNRIFNGRIPKEYVDRANYELEVIKNMGFSNYFLVVQDFVNWAKNNGIPVGPGRGSAAGALITYALGITQIDPIKYNLIFERFLNPERVTMPDIDVDVADRDRDKVINYLTGKYGKENTANIITFGTLQTKAAIRDVGRVLGIDLKRVDEIAKSLSNVDSISDAKELIREVREIIENGNKTEKEWIEISEKLEGITRHASIHASGIVISSAPIHEFIALYKDPKEGTISTQIAAQYLEEIGFLKMDILGLSNLSIIQDTIEIIKKRRGIEIDISSIPLDDKLTYELLSSGYTDGVFQVESDGMKEMLKNMRPSTIEDIIAALALYRPGPLGSGMDKQYINRKHGLEEIKYPHKDLEDILKETYGVILYQEQIMKIAQKICGFTLGQADNLRRAIGKKKREIMERMKEEFVNGAVKNGYSEEFAKELFDTIEKFAEYGFNKSHSAAYAIITYQTAYLKAHYPEEYLTSLINSEIGKFDKMTKYINEALRMKIKILSPDINKSKKLFEIEETEKGVGIRFGFMGIKGLGEASVDEIIKDREENGEYKTIEEFFERTNKFLKKNAYEALIKSGTLDNLYKKRGKLLQGLEKSINAFNLISKDRELGQHDLFLSSQATKTKTSSIEEILSNIEDLPSSKLIELEKETIGISLSLNPFKEYKHIIKNITFFNTSYISYLPEGCPFSILGMITSIQKREFIKGEIVNLKVIDFKNKEIDLFLSTEATKKFYQILEENKIFVFKGKITKSTSTNKLFLKVNKVIDPQFYKNEKITEFHILVEENSEQEKLLKLREILKNNEGKCITYLGIINSNSIDYYRLPPQFMVKPSQKLSTEISSLEIVKSFWYY